MRPVECAVIIGTRVDVRNDPRFKDFYDDVLGRLSYSVIRIERSGDAVQKMIQSFKGSTGVHMTEAAKNRLLDGVRDLDLRRVKNALNRCIESRPMPLRRIDLAIVEEVLAIESEQEESPPSDFVAATAERPQGNADRRSFPPSPPASVNETNTACVEAEKLLATFLKMSDSDPDEPDLHKWVDAELNKQPAATRATIKEAFYLALVLRMKWRVPRDVLTGLRIQSTDGRPNEPVKKATELKWGTLVKNYEYLLRQMKEGHPLSDILTSYRAATSAKR